MLPVRDAAGTLGPALASVKRQLLADFECWIIDDGSRDRSRQVAARFAERDSRFRLLERPAEGLVAALNTGIAQARAGLVARMDADDIMLRRRLLTQYQALQADPALAGVGCHVRLFPRAMLTNGRREYEAWLNSLECETDVQRDRFVECPLAHPTWMIKTALLRKLAYRAHRGPEDYDLLLRLLGSGHRLGVVPEQLLLWRDHATRLSRVDARYRIDRFTWLKAWHLSLSFLDGHSEYLLWGYGATGKALCRELSSRGHNPSHIVEVHPGRLGQIIQGALVITASDLASLRGRPLVVSVAGLGPRSQIRAALHDLRFVEGIDFVCAA